MFIPDTFARLILGFREIGTQCEIFFLKTDSYSADSTGNFESAYHLKASFLKPYFDTENFPIPA
ncbi:hypothetical protein BIV59_15620 [Bacillus sp. MUM 13]|nr:hypothetical protein BIV59_15620 [Bacillus sp. MUM 13]